MFAHDSHPRFADIDAAEDELRRLERLISRARGRQTELLRWLDEVQVARVEGARSLEEWTASRMDVAPATARDLVSLARADKPSADDLPATFDRRVAVAAFRAVGATDDQVMASAESDLKGLRRRTAVMRRTSRIDERRVAEQRFLSITPTLGDAAWDIKALAPSVDGQVIWDALSQRSDELIGTAGESVPRGQRMLDALTALAQDYLDGDGSTLERGGAGSSITVFVDATKQESHAAIPGGPSVGMGAIERIICEGTTKLIALEDGRPVAETPRTRTIPPATRLAVLQRDQGCTMDGCRSRYRLQPHHIAHRAHGGDHSLANLTTLCWYHHHIAVHAYGKQLDPDSPPQRRRFLRWRKPDPPFA